MYWHHKDVQIAFFCDVIPHAVADMYWQCRGSTPSTFRISDPNNSMQDTLLEKREKGEGVVRGLQVIKTLSSFTQPSLSRSPDAETDRNYISNYILFNSQGEMTVHLLELQPRMVLLPIRKITDEAIWIMSRMIINRRNLT